MFRGLMIACTTLFLGSAPLATGAPQGLDLLPEDLRITVAAFCDAIESGDAEARIALLAEDVVLMPNHWTMIQGREAVAAVFRAGEGSVFKLRDRRVIQAAFSGDLAYTVNSYFYTYHPEGTDPQWHKTKNVHVWKRDSAGSWKLQVDIWNSDVPMDDFRKE
jgi:ketosteroid isomerase-like protein